MVLIYKSPEKGKFLYLRFCWSSQLSLPGAVAGLSDGPQSSLQPENTRVRDTEGPPCSRGCSRDNVKPMYILQVPDEPREPSTVSGPWSDGPVPTLSTTTNGTRGLPSRTYGGTLPTSSGLPLPRIPTVWLAGRTSGAS